MDLGGDDEVEIKVHFAGVNFFDALLVKGLYQTKPKFPFTPGAEFSGVITRVGSKAHSSGLKLGNQVFGTSPTMGGFGDKIIMKPKLGMLFNLPNGNILISNFRSLKFIKVRDTHCSIGKCTRSESKGSFRAILYIPHKLGRIIAESQLKGWRNMPCSCWSRYGSVC